ncbi:MAG TPA: AAA family ATPase [Candidatus Cloacimonadota bacterium]|jgi:AAA15 family ATPase/GTPase|nr:AAA family ATPase [Candidatus Cloacimonadota bacterium]
MINQVNIKNFKSIKDITFSCKKLNVFIGEPNSGKSNILEAMSLQSQNAIGDNLNEKMFRYKTIGDLFYDFNINKPIEINSNVRNTVLKYGIRENGAPDNQFTFLFDSVKDIDQPVYIAHDGKILHNSNSGKTDVHLYEYKRLSKFSQDYLPYLSVPNGENLPSLLLSNSEYKKWVSDFLKSKYLTLTLKPTENEILASKIVEDEIYSYPYFSLSETLQRIIFYTIAIKSNKENVILLDEPESNTFPFYTKILAERIALDETNQFFIATHNPYLLLSLIEKSNQNDLNVCIVQMKNYQTSITVLKPAQVSEVLELNSDVFFNFDKILDL